MLNEWDPLEGRPAVGSAVGGLCEFFAPRQLVASAFSNRLGRAGAGASPVGRASRGVDKRNAVPVFPGEPHQLLLVTLHHLGLLPGCRRRLGLLAVLHLLKSLHLRLVNLLLRPLRVLQQLRQQAATNKQANHTNAQDR
eukprot:GHVT01005601.1.p1 GENE.GHVT01005601.1~~GHVT01005601.1.p1  ORF type:complete len:139 (+),score=26.93 GHVT01005601.1:308-724(+)